MTEAMIDHETQLPVLRIPTDVSPHTAESLTEAYSGYFTEAAPLVERAGTISVTDPTQVDEIRDARKTRLALRRIRCDADNTRKKLKAGLLLEGRAIDGICNVLKFALEPLEDSLAEQENIAERIAAKRKAKLVEDRTAELSDYCVDCSAYRLGDMKEAAFNELLDATRIAHVQRLAAEQQAEADRIAHEQAEAAERKRIADENARLRREAAERDKAAASERAEADAERKKIEAQAKADRQARENAEAELEAKRLEGARAMAADAARAASARRAPDKVKLADFATAISNTESPSVTSPEATAIRAEAHERLDAVAIWICDQIRRM